jgi:hypothetical protein
MVKPRSNKNGTVATASTAGPGKRIPDRRPNAHAATGRVRMPVIVMILNATS